MPRKKPSRRPSAPDAGCPRAESADVTLDALLLDFVGWGEVEPPRMSRRLRDRDRLRGWPLKVRRLATVDLVLRRIGNVPREERVK